MFREISRNLQKTFTFSRYPITVVKKRPLNKIFFITSSFYLLTSSFKGPLPPKAAPYPFFVGFFKRSGHKKAPGVGAFFVSVQALEALGHSEICQNLRLVGHAVLFGDFPDDPAGVACGEGTGRDVPGDHGPRADDAAIPDGDAGAHHHVGTQPHVAANVDGLGVAQALGLPIGAKQGVALLGDHGWA